MKKAVLISIRPQWCELIANGKKTIEVRKTRPKLQPPFKVYIYCTKDNKYRLAKYRFEKGFVLKKYTRNPPFITRYFFNGKVVGEFVCDDIDRVAVYNGILYCERNSQAKKLSQMCMTLDEVATYLGKKNDGYNWHISDLKIYERPKDLSDFIMPSKIGCCNEGKCRGCKYLDRGNGYNVEDDCFAPFCTDEYKPIRKAPQSWCYCVELKEENK